MRDVRHLRLPVVYVQVAQGLKRLKERADQLDCLQKMTPQVRRGGVGGWVGCEEWRGRREEA
jgi:hypothetical protein